MKKSCHLRSRKTTNWPTKRPIDVFLQQGVFLLNTIPNHKSYNNCWSEQNKQVAKRLLLCWLYYHYNQQSSYKRYHGTSATTSGWLKILAAACLLLVGMGSPAGVYASHITWILIKNIRGLHQWNKTSNSQVVNWRKMIQYTTWIKTKYNQVNCHFDP